MRAVSLEGQMHTTVKTEFFKRLLSPYTQVFWKQLFPSFKPNLLTVCVSPENAASGELVPKEEPGEPLAKEVIWPGKNAVPLDWREEIMSELSKVCQDAYIFTGQEVTIAYTSKSPAYSPWLLS